MFLFLLGNFSFVCYLLWLTDIWFAYSLGIIKNNATVNIHVCFCMDICFHFFFFESIPRSEMVRYVFNFLRNSQIIFQNDCTIFHSYQV